MRASLAATSPLLHRRSNCVTGPGGGLASIAFLAKGCVVVQECTRQGYIADYQSDLARTVEIRLEQRSEWPRPAQIFIVVAEYMKSFIDVCLSFFLQHVDTITLIMECSTRFHETGVGKIEQDVIGRASRSLNQLRMRIAFSPFWGTRCTTTRPLVLTVGALNLLGPFRA